MTMDLASLTIGLPFLPVRGVVALARVLQEEAERELYDPARVRREIEDIETAQAEGEITDDVADRAKQEAVSRLIQR
jgi:Gas vesicle protein G